MVLTVETALAHVRDTLGDGDLSTEISELAMLNAAGHQFVGMYEWRFLRANQTSLSFVADQDYLDLPSGIKAIRAIESTNSLTSGIRLTSLAEVLERRTQTDTGTFFYDAAAIFVNDTNGVPQPKLALWPTPDTTTTDSVRLFYDRGWTDVESDTGVIPVPGYAELAFLQVLRAVVRGWVEEDEGTMEQRLELVSQGQPFKAAKRADDSIQTDFGFPRGGIADLPVHTLQYYRQDWPAGGIE